MWFLRRMSKVSRKEKMKIEDVLEKVCVERSRPNTIKAKENEIFGHTKRHVLIIKNILEGCMEGKRPRGRPRAQWCDNIKEWSVHNLSRVHQIGRAEGLVAPNFKSILETG